MELFKAAEGALRVVDARDRGGADPDGVPLLGVRGEDPLSLGVGEPSQYREDLGQVQAPPQGVPCGVLRRGGGGDEPLQDLCRGQQASAPGPAQCQVLLVSAVGSAVARGEEPGCGDQDRAEARTYPPIEGPPETPAW